MCFLYCTLHRSNSTQLNAIAMWSCSDTRLYLADHAEGLATALLHRSKHFYVIRINTEYKHRHLVHYTYCKNHVSEVQDKSNRVIPAYTNVYIVRITGDHKQCHCSCNERFHNGRPCVHIIAMLDGIHPQYFHPRYYKIYNSHLYNADVDVK